MKETRLELPRKRCGGPRSRSGCLICRQRHLRCDETRPTCKRCEAAGWQCDYTGGGRNRQIKWKCSERAVSSPATPERPLLAPDEHPDLTVKERKAIAYFSQVAAGQIFGYLISDLWTHLVPQRYHTSRPIRSAVLAFTCMHQDFVAASQGAFRGAEMVRLRSCRHDQYYGDALVQLQAYIESEDAPSKLEVLLTCMTLLCCTLLQRTAQESTQHLDIGLKILEEWEQDIEHRRSSGRSHLEDSEIELVASAFGVMDVHATAYDNARVPTLTPFDRKSLANFGSHTMNHFESFKDAQRVLNQLLKAAFKDLIQCAPYKFRSIAEVPQHLMRQRRTNRMSFKKWLVALESLQKKNEAVQMERIRTTIAVMRAQHLVMETLLNETLCEGSQADEFLFDTTASQLLQWAELAISGGQPTLSERREFSIDIGVVPQLFLLAVKTSQEEIRHRAISAIRRIRRQEGWYDPPSVSASLSLICARQAEECVEHSSDLSDGCDVSVTRTNLEWPVQQLIAENFGDDSDGIGRLQELTPFSVC